MYKFNEKPFIDYILKYLYNMDFMYGIDEKYT
jgi:hypothetical protein